MDEEQSILDFNFWPSFTDLMLSLVLIMILVVFIIYASLEASTIKLRHIETRQLKLITDIATQFHVQAKRSEGAEGAIYELAIYQDAIIIKNEPTIQRFSFSTQILFDPDSYQLKPSGQQAIGAVGALIKQQLGAILEIQIQGHADTDSTKRFDSNLNLGAQRAIEVFEFMEDSVGIDPSHSLMSATSFGEYKPVQRTTVDSTYNRIRLETDNATPELKTRNRRIELLLFYRSQ